MERTTIHVELLDDLDQALPVPAETPATDSLQLSLDGKVVDIDLSDVHAKELREFLAPYLAAGRKASGPPRRPANPKMSGSAIVQARVLYRGARAWGRTRPEFRNAIDAWEHHRYMSPLLVTAYEQYLADGGKPMSWEGDGPHRGERRPTR